MTLGNSKEIALVVGGAASGKSAIAEKMIHFSGLSPVYLATAQIFDDEMKVKISLHQDRRGPEWRTIEAPFDLVTPLADLQTGQIALIDCLTLWLTNHLLAETDLDAEIDRLITGLAAAPVPVVVVTNEVGAGIVPEVALARRFREAQGRLNQLVAAQADRVVTVIAGLPLTLKAPA